MRSLFVFMFCLLLAVPAAALGERNDKGAERFTRKLQELVAKDRRGEVAKMISYPLGLNTDAEPAAKNAAEFVAKYDAIFTKAVKECLAGQDPKDIEWVKGIYRLGWGCIWYLPLDEENKTIRIDRIYTREW